MNFKFSLFNLFFLVISLASCKNDQKPQTEIYTPDPNAKPKEIILSEETPVSYTEAATWAVTEGTVFWKATKATGSSHHGTVKISGGELKVNQGRLLDGTVSLDMTSIQVVDIQEVEDRTELEKHLKGADFFDVKKHPTASFDIEESLPSQLPEFNRVLNGALNLKGKTGTVNIPVNLKIEGTGLTAESATFMIDRTKWDIKYQSSVVGTAKDKLIDDKILLSLKLSAKAN